MRLLLLLVFLLAGTARAQTSYDPEVSFDPAPPTSTRPVTALVRLGGPPRVAIREYFLERNGNSFYVGVTAFDTVAPGTALPARPIPLGNLAPGNYRIIVAIATDIGVPPPAPVFHFQVDPTRVPTLGSGALAALAVLLLVFGLAARRGARLMED